MLLPAPKPMQCRSSLAEAGPGPPTPSSSRLADGQALDLTIAWGFEEPFHL
jgi:hypothetical protein